MNKKHLKDPGSAITHFIGMLMAIFAGIPLLIKAAHEPSPIYLISLTIYLVSMILLYAASTIYHSLDISEKVNKRLKKFDHMMISVLIAGSYTPICLQKKAGRFFIISLRNGKIFWTGMSGKTMLPYLKSEPAAEPFPACSAEMQSG